MSVHEKRMRMVLPLVEIYLSSLLNAPGRTTLVRLGMSSNQFTVNENHSQK